MSRCITRLRAEGQKREGLVEHETGRRKKERNDVRGEVDGSTKVEDDGDMTRDAMDHNREVTTIL